jgi:hypothetical protein
MKHGLISAEKLRQMAKDRLTAGDWWTFLPCDYEGRQALIQIEETFYTDEAGWDFEIAALGNFVIAWGRKSQLSPRRLEKLMRRRAVSVPKITGEQDIVILIAEGNDSAGWYAIAQLSQLLSQPFPNADLN